MTEIFMQFLNTELHGNEKKAFIEEIRRYLMYGPYGSSRCHPMLDYPTRSKDFVEKFISYGIRTTDYFSVCSSLSSFMRYLLTYKLPNIIGYSDNTRHMHPIYGYARVGKNQLIRSMNYDCGEKSYRKFHIDLYVGKWHDFLEKNVCDYRKTFHYRSACSIRFKMKDGQDNSI